MSTTTPAGWYDDGHGALRWWDGAQWTEHVHTPDPAPVSPIPSAPAGPAPVYVAGADYDVAPGAPGYAGPGAPDYAGPYEAAGLPGTTPAPEKSRLWIIFVILGVVLIGLIIAASIIIPRLISAVSDGVDPGEVIGGDEQAAVDIVEDYDDAWDSADCDEYLAATTERFRAEGGFNDCAEFEEQAAAFADSTDEYDIDVTGTSREGDSITIDTRETYLILLDDDGNPVDDPEQGSDVYTYVLVPQDSGWAIDEIR